MPVARRRRVVSAIIVALIAGIAPFAAPDTLVLQDGRRLTGEVTQTDTGYLIKLKAGQLAISAGDVLKWEKDAPGGSVSTPVTPATAPATPPAPVKPLSQLELQEVNARAGTLIRQGGAALRAGDARAAVDSFLDARSLWDRAKVRIDANDPNHFAMLEGLGTAYMAMARFDKANEPLDKAYASPMRDRSLTLNRANLDLVQHVSVLRGAKDLMAFLETAPKVDEAALNLLGSALARAAADNQLTRTPLFQQAADFYEKKNKELEKSHPGKARWGTEWMSTTKARIKKDEFNNAMDHWKWTLDRQAKAADEQRSAQAAYDQARSAAMLRNSSSAASNLRSASDRLSRAKDALAEADAQVKDAWAAVPRPEWPKTFAPALPEFAGGGEFGAPRHRTEAVAVATPKPVVPAAPRSTEKRPPVGEPTPPPPETPPPQPPTDVAHVVATESVTRYAVAVPVGPDLLLTAAAPIEKATEFKLESPSGNIFTAQLVRKDGTLALLRVPGQQFAFLNLASTFAGGEVACWGYPEVSIFSPVADSILTSAPAPREKGWNLSLRRHPRLAGAAVVDKSGSLVGLTLGDRESAMTQMPAATAEQIRAFLGTDAPKSLCANPDPRGVLQLIATRAGN